MFPDKENQAAIEMLKGKVEWIYTKIAPGRGIEVVARVNSELVGLHVYDQELSGQFFGLSRIPRPPRPGHIDIVISPLERDRILHCVRYIELSEELNLLTAAESQEQQELSEADERKEAERKQRRERESLERKRREFEQLKKELGEE